MGREACVKEKARTGVVWGMERVRRQPATGARCEDVTGFRFSCALLLRLQRRPRAPHSCASAPLRGSTSAPCTPCAQVHLSPRGASSPNSGASRRRMRRGSFGATRPRVLCRPEGSALEPSRRGTLSSCCAIRRGADRGPRAGDADSVGRVRPGGDGGDDCGRADGRLAGAVEPVRVSLRPPGAAVAVAARVQQHTHPLRRLRQRRVPRRPLDGT